MLGGVILDFELIDATGEEWEVAEDLLPTHPGRTFLGDKGYVGAELAARLSALDVRLVALRRANQREPLPKALTDLVQRFRQIIETVNRQLCAQLNVEHNYAHRFWGLCARLYTKLAAHTLCIHLNRLLDTPDWLQIKGLAFPTGTPPKPHRRPTPPDRMCQ
jgi:hypothetical protein